MQGIGLGAVRAFSVRRLAFSVRRSAFGVRRAWDSRIIGFPLGFFSFPYRATGGTGVLLETTAACASGRGCA
jgi:hypothetical protein